MPLVFLSILLSCVFPLCRLCKLSVTFPFFFEGPYMVNVWICLVIIYEWLLVLSLVVFIAKVHHLPKMSLNVEF